MKLLRVLMLGPVVLLLGLISGRQGGGKPKLSSLVPWFIIGFLGMMILRSLGLIPAEALKPIATAASVLTIISMAALGLSVNLRTVLAAGGRVLAAGALSIAVLAALRRSCWPCRLPCREAPSHARTDPWRARRLSAILRPAASIRSLP